MLIPKPRMPRVHPHAPVLVLSMRSALPARVGVVVEVQLPPSDSSFSGDPMPFSSVLKSHGCLSERARGLGSVYFTLYWFL